MGNVMENHQPKEALFYEIDRLDEMRA